jgi:hypothetical protein
MKFGEAIDKLAKELGAEVGIHLLPVKETTIMLRRRMVANQYHNYPQSIAPSFSTDEPKLTVVWERPKEPTDKERTLLRKALIEGNVWDNNVSHVWCVPELGSKATTLTENAKYRPWLLNAVEAAGARYVLLVGSRAAWQWRPDLRLSKTEGRIGIWRQRQVIMPVANPATLPKGDMVAWRRQVARLLRVMREGGDINELPTTCIECSGQLWWYDPDGVAWCKEHAEAGVKAQEKGVKKWQIETTAAGQISLL